MAKQYTYARNVIQWNLNLFLDGHNAPEESDRYRKICLRDPLTEGYNVIPNFFISASIDAETLSYADRTVPHPHQPQIRRQFFNRLYDRDTLLLSHYDVNFLFVIALYARHHLPSQAAWREGVRRKFREAVQEMLRSHFDFYAMSPHPDVDTHEYITSHFQSTLGKTFSPFQQRGILSLALEQGEEYREENERLLTELRRNFYVVPCPLGTDPVPVLEEAVASAGEVRSPGARARVILGDIRRWETREGMQVTTAEYVAAQSGGLSEYRFMEVPAMDIMSIRHFAPIIDGGISGYYDVIGIHLDTQTHDIESGQVRRIGALATHTLRLDLGEHHPLPTTAHHELRHATHHPLHTLIG